MMRWTPSNDLIAQLGHAGWGALFVTCAALFRHRWIGVVLCLGWALPKEFIFDRYVERQTMADNVKDFLFYAIGMAGGCVLALLAG